MTSFAIPDELQKNVLQHFWTARTRGLCEHLCLASTQLMLPCSRSATLISGTELQGLQPAHWRCQGGLQIKAMHPDVVCGGFPSVLLFQCFPSLLLRCLVLTVKDRKVCLKLAADSPNTLF